MTNINADSANDTALPRDLIYEREEIKDDPTDLIYKILGLCKMGIAGTDTLMNVDLHKSGHQEQYEAIFKLAYDALSIVEEGQRLERIAAKA